MTSRVPTFSVGRPGEDAVRRLVVPEDSAHASDDAASESGRGDDSDEFHPIEPLNALDYEWTHRDDLTTGDRVLLLPGERVPRDAVVEYAYQSRVADAGVSDFSAVVQPDEENWSPREATDAVEAGAVVRARPVVVRVRGGAVPWWLTAAGVGRIVGSVGRRQTVLLAVVALALVGAGIGFLGPGSVFGPTPNDPGSPPPVSVTPPGTATGTPGVATPTDTTTQVPTPQTPSETDRSTPSATATPPETDRSTPSATATPPETDRSTPSATDTPTDPASTPTGGSGPPGSGPPGESGSETTASPTATPGEFTIDVTASDPPLVVSPGGNVSALGGQLDGTVSWSSPAVDGIVVVLQTWIPSKGWTETDRVVFSPSEVAALDDHRLSLADLFGETVYAAGDRARPFANPADGTTRARSGRVGVTAVFFVGETEVGRVNATDEFTATVRNTPADAPGDAESPAFDLRLSNDTATRGPNDRESLLTFQPNGTVTPGSSSTSRGRLDNAGTTPGTVVVNVSLRSFENGQTEPEAAVDPTGGDPGLGRGELHEETEVRVAVLTNGSTRYVFGGPDSYRPLTELVDDSVVLTRLQPGEAATLRVEFHLPTTAGNEVQSDSFQLGYEFTMRNGSLAPALDEARSSNGLSVRSIARPSGEDRTPLVPTQLLGVATNSP